MSCSNPEQAKTQIKKREEHLVRILLQHARTGLYLRGLGDWTANVQEGFDFQHSQKAINFACEHALKGVQIAVRFTDSEFDEVAPLPPLASAGSESRPLL
jgi:hypothetical protein